MSRTYRKEPSSGCWMRRPHHIRAKRQLIATVDALHDENIVLNKQRHAVAPDDWEDQIVSYIRGQSWTRKTRL